MPGQGEAGLRGRVSAASSPPHGPHLQAHLPAPPPPDEGRQGGPGHGWVRDPVTILPSFSRSTPATIPASQVIKQTRTGRAGQRPAEAGTCPGAAEVRAPPQPPRWLVWAQASGSHGSLAAAHPPRPPPLPPPRPAPSWQSPTGGGQRPPTLSQAPEQLRPDHSLDGHHAFKPVLTALTNVCLESFFFFKQRRAACQNLPIQKCAYGTFPCRPKERATDAGWSSERREHKHRFPTRPSRRHPATPPPPGPRAPGGAPTAKPHQLHRPQDHGVGCRLAEGQRALCLSHGTWPPHWALTRVLSRGLGGPLPHVHGTMQPVAPSDMPTATRQDCLPPTRQPPALHSKTATSVWVTGPEPTHRARTSANTNSRPRRSGATPKPAAHHAARLVHGQPGTASRRLAGN